MKGFQLSASAALALLLGACATQHYGRLQPVTYAEQSHLTCQQVNLEIARAQSFIKQTRAHEEEFTLNDVTGFLTSLGIANAREYDEAMDMARTRLHQLKVIRAKYHCSRHRKK